MGANKAQFYTPNQPYEDKSASFEFFVAAAALCQCKKPATQPELKEKESLRVVKYILAPFDGT